MTTKTATRQALLVMDFQEGVVEHAPDPKHVLDAASEAIDAAHKHEIPVIFVKVAFRPGFPEVSAKNKAFSVLHETGHFSHDDPTTRLHPSLKRDNGDVVVDKKRVSAFTGSDLELILRSRHITSLALAGIATSGVVLSTLREAADLDYELTVLGDACADGDEEVHRVLLDKVFPRQADVVTVSDWAHHLDGHELPTKA